MSADQIIALVAAAAWPIVAVLALVLLRVPLTTAIAELGRRTTTLDLHVVTFEFAQGIAPDWRVDVAGRTTDVRHLTSDAVTDSYSHSLFDQLAKADPAGALVIDLGEGREWLTTRLYLFCAVLEQLRSVQCVVLLHAARGKQRQVLGAVSPNAIRRALAIEEPWLESTYASAWHDVVGVQGPPGTVISTATADDVKPRGIAMNTQAAMEVARAFVRLNQRHKSPENESDQWQEFTESLTGAIQPTTFWEHTQWIRAAALPRSVSAVLDTRSIVPVDPAGSPSNEKRSMMLQEGDFVILAHRDGTLRGVVHRATLLDGAIRVALRGD